jgi:transcriptional regulator with XRE-family HTH domain
LIAEKIKKIREYSGLNQKDFGEKLDVNQRTVSNWESGRNQPPIEVLQIMLRMWEVSPSWLLLDIGEINSTIDNFYFKAKEHAILNNKENDLQNELVLFLNKQDTIEIIRKIEKIKGQTLLEKISESWTGKGERMLRVFHYFLQYLQKQNIQLDPSNMKNDFIEALKNFDVPSNAKKIFLSSMTSDQKALIEWASRELDESSIFEILSALPILLQETSNHMNIFDQFIIKMTTK